MSKVKKMTKVGKVAKVRKFSSRHFPKMTICYFWCGEPNSLIKHDIVTHPF